MFDGLKAPESLRMPLPMVTMLASGKNVAGKLRCVKEFLVVPAPGMPLVDVRSLSLDLKCEILLLFMRDST